MDINQIIAAKKFGKGGGSGGSSGPVSWNDLPDKPFYEEQKSCEITTATNGGELANASGQVRWYFLGYYYSLPLPYTEGVTGSVRVGYTNINFEIYKRKNGLYWYGTKNASDPESLGIYGSGYIVINTSYNDITVDEPGYNETYTFKGYGVYCNFDPGTYNINWTKITPLADKYVPNTVARVADLPATVASATVIYLKTLETDNGSYRYLFRSEAFANAGYAYNGMSRYEVTSAFLSGCRVVNLDDTRMTLEPVSCLDVQEKGYAQMLFIAHDGAEVVNFCGYSNGWTGAT